MFEDFLDIFTRFVKMVIYIILLGVLGALINLFVVLGNYVEAHIPHDEFNKCTCCYCLEDSSYGN